MPQSCQEKVDIADISNSFFLYPNRSQFCRQVEDRIVCNGESKKTFLFDSFQLMQQSWQNSSAFHASSVDTFLGILVGLSSHLTDSRSPTVHNGMFDQPYFNHDVADLIRFGVYKEVGRTRTYATLYDTRCDTKCLVLSVLQQNLGWIKVFPFSEFYTLRRSFRRKINAQKREILKKF